MWRADHFDDAARKVFGVVLIEPFLKKRYHRAVNDQAFLGRVPVLGTLVTCVLGGEVSRHQGVCRPIQKSRRNAIMLSHREDGQERWRRPAKLLLGRELGVKIFQELPERLGVLWDIDPALVCAVKEATDV